MPNSCPVCMGVLLCKHKEMLVVFSIRLQISEIVSCLSTAVKNKCLKGSYHATSVMQFKLI